MPSINNSFYETLGEQWHEACDHPIAILRAENALRTPWVIETIRANTAERTSKVLDIGCGAGLLCNPLALAGHDVFGIDLSPSSLKEALKKDTTQSVQYLVAPAEKLPFSDGSFDVVCALDLLEHVESPSIVIAEASRVLKPGGLFFFHTFNRNFLSWLLVIKAVEWFVPNTPPHMHVLDLFITPKELHRMCEEHGLRTKEVKGMRPVFFSNGFWKSFFSREVSSGFRFTFTRSLKTGYLGFSTKE